MLRRLDAVERELREIKQRVGFPSDLDKQRDSIPHTSRDSYVESVNTGAVLQVPDLNEMLTSRGIGNVVLDPSSVSTLLEEYDLLGVPRWILYLLTQGTTLTITNNFR